MAKQSARSKGYRKTVKKKPFLTKKEIIELVVIVAVIVVGIVAFNLFYDDGYLRASDVKPGDVVSYVSRDIDSRYVKVATANELPGFSLEQPDMSDNARVIYNYVPDEPTENIEYLALSGSYISAEQQVSSVQSSMASFGMDSVSFTEEQTTQIQGHDAHVYSYTSDYYSEDKAKEQAEAQEPAEGEEEPAEAEAAEGEEEQPAEAEAAEGEEEHESNVYTQTIGCYVDVDDYTICFHIYRTGDDDSFYLPEDQVMDFLLPYTDAFTVYEKEEK